MTRHNGRDRVLIDELGMPIPSQQHAEIVEPGDNSLQFHTVHEKYREWYFGLANVIEKRVLQILCAIGGHGRYFRCLLAFPQARDGMFRTATGPFVPDFGTDV